ncbi:hypothetical protein Hanom_Chr02g00162991 [Helianthus anomalus]
MTSVTLFLIYDYVVYIFSYRVSFSCMDPIFLQQLKKLLEDVIESDRVLFEKLNDLSVRVASIHKKQVELQISINALYTRSEAKRMLKSSFNTAS